MQRSSIVLCCNFIPIYPILAASAARLLGPKPQQISAYLMLRLSTCCIHPRPIPPQTLRMAAELRLPQHMTAAQKDAYVQHLMGVLGLSKVAGTRVGDDKNRGLSGGGWVRGRACGARRGRAGCGVWGVG